MIAEQVLRGGVAAVRQAVDKMNEEARAEGRAEVKAEPLLVVAERLLPTLRAAEWRDRAEAAVTDLDELDLRDLRSVVVAAETGAKDDESRALSAQLREGLARRVDQEQSAWLAEIAETLSDGRTVRALRLSSRPPKAGAPLPGELATRLSDAAGAALTAETVTDRWATVLDALSFSPVRLTVVPTSKPAEPNPELVRVITRQASRVPKVAEAFGIEPPAEASPRRRGPRPGAKASSKGASRTPKPKPQRAADGSPPIPPPPPAPATTPGPALPGVEGDAATVDSPAPAPAPVGGPAARPDDGAPAAGSNPWTEGANAASTEDQAPIATGAAEAGVVDVAAPLVDDAPAAAPVASTAPADPAETTDAPDTPDAADVVDVTAALVEATSEAEPDGRGAETGESRST